jgi:hypothetical protein
MHLLHRRLDTDGNLREIIDNLNGRIVGNPFKQALILDLNPYWLVAIGLEKSGLADDYLWRVFSGRFNHWEQAGWFFRPGAAAWALRSSAIWAGIDDADFARSSDAAHEITNRVFGRPVKPSPFLLRIFAYPADDVPTRSPEAERSFDGGARNQLVEAARETPIPTIVETQPPARFVVGSGDRIFSSSGKYGTLGGFLKDGSALYGVTCGHVIAQGGDARTTDGLLGRVKHAASPEPLQPGVVCDRHCHGKTDLDVALIDLESSRAICAAASVVETISMGNLVEMNGAMSGRKLYEVGPIAVDIEIKGTCWDRLFLVHAPVSNSVLEPGVNALLTPMPAEGDSGAWLFRNGDQWAGMVIATSPLYAFALAGTTIIANSNNRFSTNLTLPDVSRIPKPTGRWRAFANLLSGRSR